MLLIGYSLGLRVGNICGTNLAPRPVIECMATAFASRSLTKSVMNQHAADAPRDGSDPPDQIERMANRPDGDDPVSLDSSNAVDQDSDLTDDATTTSAPVDSSDEASVRVGSPFVVDPTEPQPARIIEPVYDVGPLRYTAMGAVAAAVMVMGFALVAAWWFPPGGTLIAALGCLLSIWGLSSAFRKTSAALLAAHLSLFVLCYSQSVG